MAKTVGQGKGSTLRRRVSAEPETELVDSSSDELRDEELVASEDDEPEDDELEDDELEDDDLEDDDLEDDPDDDIGSGSSVLAPSDIPSDIRHIEGRPRTVHIPEWMMGNVVTRYAAESFVELYSNTTWPTWREAWNFTLIVIAMSTVIAIILGVADLGLAQVLNWFLGLGK